MITDMNLDFFTITALANEFRLTIMGGRVQKIVQITTLTYGLELYTQRQRRYLHLSAEPQMPRVHLQAHKPRRGEGNQTPLYQLLRKYLAGSILMSVEQPAYERLLLFHFSGQEGETSLVIELLGHRSNLIFLLPPAHILAVARPIGGQFARRVLLPNHPYTLPPSQNKLDPLTLTQKSLRTLVKSVRPDKMISDALVARLAGLSSLIAREIVALAYGHPLLTISQADNIELLLAAIQQVYRRVSEHCWAPHIALDEDGSVKFFAPLPLSHLARTEPVSTMSEGVERHFLVRLGRPVNDGYAVARQSTLKRIKKAGAKLARRLKKLDEDAAGLKDPARYRQKGDAILTYSTQIRPRQTELRVEWLNDVIVLNPNLSPSDNAQRYFARYKKAKRAAKIIPQQRRAVDLKLNYLKQLTLDLKLAESRPEIDVVAVALQEAGLDHRRKKKKTAKLSPIPQTRKFISPDGFTVQVGRNALDNHRLTFSRANPSDVWLHVRGQPGAHVVISTAQREPPRSTLLWAAGIAAYYSKARGENQVEVSYTLKKHVRAIKGAPPGLVTLRQEKTVRVAPAKPE